MTPIELLTVVAIAVGVIGIVLGWIGWHGRRVGDHPFCRRCGFDLFAKPESSARCPECGADIATQRATVTGVRQRRRGLLAAGLTLLLPCLSLLVMIGWVTSQKVDWQQYKPVAWLAREASGADTMLQAAALKELIRRQNVGSLSKAQVNSLVDAGLKDQGDLAKAWTPLWGDFIEAAHQAGMTSDTHWQKYAEQAVTTGWLTLRIRSKLRHGDEVRSKVVAARARVGNRSTLFASVQRSEFVLNGVETPVAFNANNWSGPIATWNQSMPYSKPEWGLQSAITRLEVGPHSGFQRMKIRVTENLPPMPPLRIPATAGSTSRPSDPAAFKSWRDAQIAALNEAYRKQSQAQAPLHMARVHGTDGSPTYADVEIQVPFRFEVVGPDEQVFTATTDESFRATIEQGISVESLSVLDRFITVSFRCRKALPVHLSFDVFLRKGQSEWKAGQVEFVDGYASLNGTATEKPPASATVFDIVLRPNAAAKRIDDPDINSYWGGEVVLRNVSVVSPAPASRGRPR